MHTFNFLTSLDLDEAGNPYVNVDVPPSAVMPYLTWLRNTVAPATIQGYIAHQQSRDRGHRHITVVTPLEYPHVASHAAGLIGYPVHVQMLGVGHIAEPDNEVFFVVCRCPEIERMRASLGLPQADLHITLGFKAHDIFDKPKGPSSLLAPFSDWEDGGFGGVRGDGDCQR